MSRKRRKARETRARDNAASDAFLYRKLPPSWRCLKCGAPMRREVSEGARRISVVTHPEAIQRDPVEICGRCRTWHIPTSDGMLRLATAAEEFEVRMECERAANLADVLPPGHLIYQPCKLRQ
jgi:hypothetical protein